MSEKLSWRTGHFLKRGETFEKLFQSVTFLKIPLFHVFFCYILGTVPKVLYIKSFQQVLLRHSILCILLVDKPNGRCRFLTTIARGNAADTNGLLPCKEISKKELDLILTAWTKQLINCCFFKSMIKQGNSLIHLANDNNLNKSLQELSNKWNKYPLNHEEIAIFIATYLIKGYGMNVSTTKN